MPRVKSKNKKEQKVIADWIYGIILFVVTGILPLLVRLAVVDMPPDLATLSNSSFYTDFFSYWRSWLLIACAVIAGFYFISDVVTGGRKDIHIKKLLRNPPVFFSMVYIVFVILSNIFTQYRYTASRGTFDRCESVFVQIAYIVIFITAFFSVRETKHAKTILAGLLLSTLLMGAVGISQLVGHDFIATPVAAWLMTGQTEQMMTPIYTSSYGLLFNPNTYGLYTAMLASLMLILGFTYNGRKMINILFMAAGALMLAGLVGSFSIGGLLGGAASFAVVIITGIGYMIVHRKRPSMWVCAAGILLCLGLSITVWFVTPIRENLTQLKDRLISALAFEKETIPRDYRFDGDTLTVTNGNKTLASLTANKSGNWITMRDGSGQIVAPSPTYSGLNGEIAYTVFPYDVPDHELIYIMKYEKMFIFDGIYLTIHEGSIVPIRQTGYAIDVLKPVPAIGFKGNERWASGRGYIWSRSIPLLLKHPILGSGSDSFVNVFPQDEFIVKRWVLSDPYGLVDKAHSLYIQTGITTGGISMVAMIALLGYYIVNTFLSLIRSRNETRSAFGLRLGLLAAISAFAVSSIATDSTIPTTGVFYVLLGMGYALNMRLQHVSMGNPAQEKNK